MAPSARATPATSLASARSRRDGVAVALGALLGLAVGVATSFLQGVLPGQWNALANAASPWLSAAFVAGVLPVRRSAAVLAGFLAEILCVVGYYATSAARGFGTGGAIVVLWVVCAVIGGPLFGWAAWRWRHRDGSALPAAAGGILPAAFVGEAIGTYALRLHYRGDKIGFLLIGLVLALALGARTRPLVWFVAGLGGLAVLAIVGFLTLQSLA